MASLREGARRALIVLPFVCVAASAAAPAAGNRQRIDLVHGDLVVSVMPSLGGRVVGLRTKGSPNLLDWDERREHAPAPPATLSTPFEPWNGRIVWAGPQSAWWTSQDLSPERKASKSVWPPDPFRETARYEVVEQTGARIVMKGPASPVTGLELTETVEIVGPRAVRFVTVATNRRETPVSWDLWPNTRVRPEGWPYVRLAPNTTPRVDAPSGGRAGAYPHRLIGEFLTLPPGTRPEPPAVRLHAKVFVEPATGEIAYFLGRQVLRLRADVVPKERLHPEQAFIELYRGAGPAPADDILELEMHGAFVTLAPGESMRFEQTGELDAYDGVDAPDAHVAFLKGLSSGSPGR